MSSSVLRCRHAATTASTRRRAQWSHARRRRRATASRNGHDHGARLLTDRGDLTNRPMVEHRRLEPPVRDARHDGVRERGIGRSNHVSRLSFGSPECVDDHFEVDGITTRARSRWRETRVRRTRDQLRLRIDGTFSIHGTATEESRIVLRQGARHLAFGGGTRRRFGARRRDHDRDDEGGHLTKRRSHWVCCSMQREKHARAATSQAPVHGR